MRTHAEPYIGFFRLGWGRKTGSQTAKAGRSRSSFPWSIRSGEDRIRAQARRASRSCDHGISQIEEAHLHLSTLNHLPSDPFLNCVNLLCQCWLISMSGNFDAHHRKPPACEGPTQFPASVEELPAVRNRSLQGTWKVSDQVKRRPS